MPLEPVEVSAEAAPNRELRDVTRRFWVGLALAAPVLVFAFAYNAVGIPVAAGVLYPACHILLGPEIAALAISVGSVSVIPNASRLRSVRL